MGVSVFTLTALSFERYSAIVKPVESFVTNSRSKLSIIICIAGIWLISIGLALPAVLFSHLLIQPGEKVSETERIRDINGTLLGLPYHEIFICYPFPPEFGPAYPKIVVVSRLLIHYCLPLLVIGFFYTIMARHLIQRYDIIQDMGIENCFSGFLL